MILAITVLAATISRADLVERFRAYPVVKCEGLVEVSGMCPADIRREYQLPVAANASDILKDLYLAFNLKTRKFNRPAIVVYLGSDVSSNRAVRASQSVRVDGTRYTSVHLPSPGYSDMAAFRREITRGFLRAVMGKEADDADVERALRMTDPKLRLDDEYAEIKAWREKGVYAKGRTDEDYLKLMRRIKNPGYAREEEVLDFSSRLMLYPRQFAMPFAGKYMACTFRDAVELAAVDPNVRLSAWLKSSEIRIFGAGRGDRFTAMVESYSDFLRELAVYGKKKEELVMMLEAADEKLRKVLE